MELRLELLWKEFWPLRSPGPVGFWTSGILRAHYRTTILNHWHGWMWRDKGTLVLTWVLKFHFYISCLFLWFLWRNLDLRVPFLLSKYFCVAFILPSWCSVLFESSVVLDLPYFHVETIGHPQDYHVSYKFMISIQGLKSHSWRYWPEERPSHCN